MIYYVHEHNENFKTSNIQQKLPSKFEVTFNYIFKETVKLTRSCMQ